VGKKKRKRRYPHLRPSIVRPVKLSTHGPGFREEKEGGGKKKKGRKRSFRSQRTTCTTFVFKLLERGGKGQKEKGGGKGGEETDLYLGTAPPKFDEKYFKKGKKKKGKGGEKQRRPLTAFLNLPFKHDVS